MIRMFATTLLASAAIVAVTALAFAEETIIEKRTVESQHNTVEEVVTVPEVRGRVIEERTVTTEPAAVQKRTDTVTTTTTHHASDDDSKD